VSSGDQFDPKKFSEDLHDRIHQDVHDRIRVRIRGRWGRDRQISGGLLPGLFLIVFGGIFLLDNMGVIPAERLWRFWPVILILVGLVRAKDSCNRIFNITLIVVGALLLLGNLGYLRFTWGELWPIILIAVGAMMIWGRMAIPRLPRPEFPGGTNPNHVVATTMFGGIERRITTSTFTGGTVTATFGGIELDFRSAEIEGEEAVLFVEAIFGGIDIVVPERWMVIYEGQSIFGGYSDETRPPLPEVPGAQPRKRLIIRGQAVFGGITVKN
jgi:predicted membrane protein